MNLTHEKYLRRITGIPDHNAIIADKVKERVDRIEKRMTRFYGRFMEMPIEMLAFIISGIEDEQVFVTPDPVLPTVEERVGALSKGAMAVQLEGLGLETTGHEKVDDLRSLLIEAIKEKEGTQKTK